MKNKTENFFTIFLCLVFVTGCGLSEQLGLKPGNGNSTVPNNNSMSKPEEAAARLEKLFETCERNPSADVKEYYQDERNAGRACEQLNALRKEAGALTFDRQGVQTQSKKDGREVFGVKVIPANPINGKRGVFWYGLTETNGRLVIVDVDFEADKTSADSTSSTPSASSTSQSGGEIAGGEMADKATTLPQPAYPALAKAAKASGPVVVEVVIDEKGEVVSAKALNGHPLLRSSAESAARQARFAPQTKDGKPVRVKGTITYNFKL